MSALLEPTVIGKGLELRNRIAMASMTRNRCIDSYKPGPAHIKYYADRARDGPAIVVSEGILVDWAGMEYEHPPFMISEDHAKAWRAVVDAVHKQGALMFFQAWHPGRCQNDEMQIMKDKGHAVLAPSAIQAAGGTHRSLGGSSGHHTNNVKAVKDPQDLIQVYRRSVQLARKAGFDGVELLCQGGYLPQQFLNSRANLRTDAYGGSVENRCRFTLELVDAISKDIGGPDSICVKICPTDVMNDSVATFDEMKEIYTYLIKRLVEREVGIITICRRGSNIGAESARPSSHFVRPEGYPLPPGYDPVLDFGRLIKRPGSKTKLMANQDYSVEEAEGLIRDDMIDLVMIGRPFIYNPDLVARIRRGIKFAENDRDGSVHYGPYLAPDENYNDWPIASA